MWVGGHLHAAVAFPLGKKPVPIEQEAVWDPRAVPDILEKRNFPCRDLIPSP